MLVGVRRAAVFLGAMALAPAAHAAAPVVTARASPATGAAPLQVTLTAGGEAATYHWELGDGASADGVVVHHTYAAGRFVARVTATSADGETAQAAVSRGQRGVATARPRRNGSFVVRGRVGTPAARYAVRYAGAVSNQVALAV